MFDIQSDLIKLQDSGFEFPNPQYLERTPEQLLSGREIPNFFKMSTLFVNKVYLLSVLGQLDDRMLCNSLRGWNRDEYGIMKGLSNLDRNEKLREFELKHFHYYENHQTYAFNINKTLFNPHHLQKMLDSDKKYDDFNEFFCAWWEPAQEVMNEKLNPNNSDRYMTGEWVVCKEYDGNVYLLDMTCHGSDDYIWEATQSVYMKEFPEIF